MNWVAPPYNVSVGFCGCLGDGELVTGAIINAHKKNQLTPITIIT